MSDRPPPSSYNKDGSPSSSSCTTRSTVELSSFLSIGPPQSCHFDSVPSHRLSWRPRTKFRQPRAPKKASPYRKTIPKPEDIEPQESVIDADFLDDDVTSSSQRTEAGRAIRGVGQMEFQDLNLQSDFDNSTTANIPRGAMWNFYQERPKWELDPSAMDSNDSILNVSGSSAETGLDLKLTFSRPKLTLKDESPMENQHEVLEPFLVQPKDESPKLTFSRPGLDLKLTSSRPKLTLKDESPMENQHEVLEPFLDWAGSQINFFTTKTDSQGRKSHGESAPFSIKPAPNFIVERASGIEGPQDHESTPSVSWPILYLEEEHVPLDHLELFPERAKGVSFSHGPFGSSYTNLVELSLNPIRSDCFSLANEVSVKLETADLSHSMFRRIPDLPVARRLQVVNLQYCINLVDLSSLCHFTRLEHLVLKGCVNLTSIPSLVNNMKLLSLDLSDCSNVKKIPDFPTSVKYLYLANTGIEELPLSMKSLLNLLALDLRDCRRLKNLPELPKSLQHLHLGYTAIEELPLSIGHLASLVVLNLRDCRRLKSLPSSITRLKSLTILSLSGCNNLLYMRELTEQMAYEFMQQECIDELFRKRFNPWDINSVLLKKRVTEKVENLLTDNPEVTKELLDSDTLTTICDVSLLKLHSFFRITASKSLSITLQMENFLEFNLPFNNLQQLWAGKLGLVNLRLINLKHSNLVRLPDLSETGSLVSLNLRRCINLVEVSSIENLAKLENLDVRGCKGLTILPSLVHLEVLKTLYLSDCSNLKELPSSIGRLKDLVLLDLKSCTGLYKLPRSVSDLKHLQVLNIAGCRKLLKRLNKNQIKELPLSIGNHFSGKTSSGKAIKKAKKECDVIMIDEGQGVLEDTETATHVQRPCTRKKAKKEYDLVILDDDQGDLEHKETVWNEALRVEVRKRKREAVKLLGIASEETKINKHRFNLDEAMEFRHESFPPPEEYEESQLTEDVPDSSLSAPESSVLLVPHPKSARSSPLSSVPALSSTIVQRVSNKPQDACNPLGPDCLHHFEGNLNGGTVSGRSSADVHEGRDEITRLQEHLAALKKRRNELYRKNSSIAEIPEPLCAGLVDHIDTSLTEQKMKVEQDAKNAWEHARNLVAEIARKLQTNN